MAKLFFGKQMPSAPKPPAIQNGNSPNDGYSQESQEFLQLRQLISDLKLSFKDKSFSELSVEDKDSLLKLMALSLNILRE